MNRALALLLCVCAAACTADDNAPFASGGDGTSSVGEGDGDAAIITSPGDDSGTADEDSGAPPATGSDCDKVEPALAANVELPLAERPSRVTLPADFVVTRSVTDWTGKCTDPALVIELSDGDCPAGDGHELKFYIAAESVRDGAILPGENAILPEPNDTGISVRYVRPSSLELHGTWGTCKLSSGVITFKEEINLFSRRKIQGDFMLTLTDCNGGDTALPAQEVSGVFNVALHSTVNEYCPDWE